MKAHRKLEEYIRLKYKTIYAFCKKYGFHQSTIHRIIHGECFPDYQTMIEIERATNTEIKLGDWRDE